MLLLAFVLPLLALLACLALNTLVPSRWLGLGAATASALAGAVVGAAALQNEPALPAVVWASLDSEVLRLSLRFDGASWLLGLLAAEGAALVMVVLALALPPHLRGFGALFAALALLVAATLAGLALRETFLLPVPWALVVLASFLAVQASSPNATSSSVPIWLLSGGLSLLALLGALLLGRAGVPGATPAAVYWCWALVGLLAVGLPPFHRALDEPADTPLSMPALLIALGLPLLGLDALARFAAAGAGPAPLWREALVAIGLVGMIASVAGALGERRARPLIAWLFSAQAGVVVIALGQPVEVLSVVVPPLITNTLLTTLGAYLAVAALEREAGTDELGAIGALGPLRLPGMALVVAAASAVGIPGTWGFWARGWLLSDLLATMPWIIPLVLSASALIAFAYLTPLAACWRAAPPDRRAPPDRAGAIAGLAATLPAVLLVVLGVAPQIGWRFWAAGAQRALAPTVIVDAPPFPGPLMIMVSAGVAVLVLLSALVLPGRSKRRVQSDPDTSSDGVLAPYALGEVVSPLAWLGAPTALFTWLWAGMQFVSRGVRRGLAPFEGRYHVAGLMIAVVVVILLML